MIRIPIRLATIRLATFCLVICLATSASAWPLVGAARRIGDLRCYPDHADPALWWYVPDRLELATIDGRPGFSFDRYRYTGTALTGDRGEFWGRGVLTFQVRFAPAPADLARARGEIERLAGSRAIALKPVPLDRIESAIVYAGIGEPGIGEPGVGEPGISGELHGGTWSGEAGSGGAGLWTERTYEIGLSPSSADALWQLYHDHGLAVSLGYSLIGKGVPASGGEYAGEEREPVAQTIVFAGNAIPIRVSPAACPECFANVEIDARIAAEYPFLEVYCYDFESGLAPTDLALVVVEVRATAITGERPREELRFAPRTGFKAAVDFEFAVRLDQGYQYRVVRVFDDGHQQTDGWQAVDSWTGILDVTTAVARARQPHGEDHKLDPRRLY